jgi:hypothetical protein
MDHRIDRNLSVYINCPYDAGYQSIFDAIVFATICCGFMPRCPFDNGKLSEPRIYRIVSTLKNCAYSIHDLSRCHGEGGRNFARFNMPFELGIAMGECFSDRTGDDGHDLLVIVPNGHIHAAYISDLAGYDPVQVDQLPAAIVPPVMSWLATRPEATRPPTPDQVLQALPSFDEAVQTLRKQWKGHELWSDIVEEAMRIAEDAGIAGRRQAAKIA